MNRIGIQRSRCEIFKQRPRDRGGEIEVKRIVERSRSVGYDTLDVEVSGADEVNGGNIVDGLPILVDEEV